MSYGLLCGRVGDHNVDPYASHITSITGREIVADKLGLVRAEAATAGEVGKLDAKPAAAAAEDVPAGGIVPPPVATAHDPAAEAVATAPPPEAMAVQTPPEAMSAAPPPEAAVGAPAFPLATPMIDMSC